MILSNKRLIIGIFLLLPILGLLAYKKIPVNVFPYVSSNIIYVTSKWPGQSSEEIESVIISKQEELIKGMNGLIGLESNSMKGRGVLILRYHPSVDISKAYVEVSSLINQHPSYPRDASEPIVETQADLYAEHLVTLYAQKTSNVISDSVLMQTINDVIIPNLQIVEGIASINPNSNEVAPMNLTIKVDNERMVSLNITLDEIIRAISQVKNVSVGTQRSGSSELITRVIGQSNVNDFLSVVVKNSNGNIIFLRDIATVDVHVKESLQKVYSNGMEAKRIYVSAFKNQDLPLVSQRLHDAIAFLNANQLSGLGVSINTLGTSIEHVEEARNSLYINMFIGSLLSLGFVSLVLRSWKISVLLLVSVPISILLTFFAIYVSGKSINLISLVGIAFTIGMVLDASLIVADSINKQLKKGLDIDRACILGVRQVSGALTASTITTIVIFIPILLLDTVEGEIFSDLAYTISFAIMISLVTALLFIPAIYSLIKSGQFNYRGKSFFGKCSSVIVRFTQSKKQSFLIVLGALSSSMIVSYFALPEKGFVPAIKETYIYGRAYIDNGENMADKVEDLNRQLLEHLEPLMREGSKHRITSFFISPTRTSMRLYFKIEDGYGDSLSIITEQLKNVIFPKITGVDLRLSVSTVYSSIPYTSSSIDLSIVSNSITKSKEVSKWIESELNKAFSDLYTEHYPSLNNSESEFHIIPNDVALANNGLTRDDLANAIQLQLDGIFLGNFFDGNQNLDVRLIGKNAQNKALDDNTQITSSRTGESVYLNSVAVTKIGTAKRNILRQNNVATQLLYVYPDDKKDLGIITSWVEEELKEKVQERFGSDVSINFDGNADSIVKAFSTLYENFLLSSAVLFIVMIAFVRSVRDTLLIFTSLPFAVMGGVISLQFIGVFKDQNLDVLSLIGFIVMIGVVVNNAILLVTQTRHLQSEGEEKGAAIEKALQTRMVPIFLSTITSLLGILPLLFSDAMGSDIYRGMAGIIFGGILVSSVFTMFVIPALLRLVPSKFDVLQN